MDMINTICKYLTVSPRVAFILVAFSLGNLGDGLNIFQGIYLVGNGWNEGSVGAALSLMGLTALIVQPFAGDWVDKATIDRRYFLTAASLVTAVSASTILMVHPGNLISDHHLIYVSKILEGIASSFIGPCLAALTMASFGPNRFDAVMASNILWGHIGSVLAAVLAGVVAFVFYPNIKYCFLVIGASALVAIVFVQQLPEGDPLMGRGFESSQPQQDSSSDLEVDVNQEFPDETARLTNSSNQKEQTVSQAPAAASYLEVLLDPKTCILCMTGFFFHFANANVLLVLGELMGGEKKDDDGDEAPSRTVIPLTAGAIVLAQFTMTVATWVGDHLTKQGMGRKPLFMAGILSLPIRCALIIWFKDAGSSYLLSTQILDGVGGGLIGLIHPYLIADITFGTGRFNVVMGLTASCFGMGATLSNFFGQMVVEHFGHVASLTGSLVLSAAPIILFSRMPETYGQRGSGSRRSYDQPPTPSISRSSSSSTSPKSENETGYQTYQTLTV
mmetsp:Transcript_9444/g.26087  ORF Transcript_9444/g.26087 Transcript_9444/m.26087 type:complete len:503 (+) Transcript_9444:246-1754(+)|eukprot:CAMPEP_0168723820 /NCGR_PEP_ID=MMETSP0724-20121128/3316_1 /TAXON_ID=265536 /ORGANISM="Amphiprora sp., Strain CCMP467" /LENGTH=502 /DNA_ID=CAMNT_0008770547 /DNA_START=241 /DNA_END=1749 /DNA_ORIENTATION=+